MNIQLIQGDCSANEATEIVAHMVHLIIKYHEHKIHSHSDEEDIKTREAKIRRLQKELFEWGKTINSKTNRVKVEAILKIELEWI
ncbi:MAG: hypothetical protein KBF75_13240 [Saprospiraceae bacterium]|mgnify:CR=1 FL=1|nr:hypothetical protein [Candidatus Opimibacter skivensis]MBP9134986.1 hypothetical protein [Saprospiraceae bacterium]